jgi:nucleolar protein 53
VRVVTYQALLFSGVIQEKPSNELFAVDIRGDAVLKEKIFTRSQRPLKADIIIAQRSAIDAVLMRKRNKQPGVDSKIAPPEPNKRQRTSFVSNEELKRLRKAADGVHMNPVQVAGAQYDIWDDANNRQHQHPVKPPSSAMIRPTSLVANGMPVKAVQRPTGGYSYNPSYDDYESRLAVEGDKALKMERNRLATEAADKALMEAAAQSAVEAELAEARANISEWDEDSAWEGFESGIDDTAAPTKRPKRKTQAQRNRMSRRKDEARRQIHDSLEKAKHDQLSIVKELITEVEAKEQDKIYVASISEDCLVSDPDDDIDVQLRRRQRGGFPLPEKDLEIILPDELQDSLRLLKPEGNLLKERYRSYLVRGAVENRKRRPYGKRARTKLTEKWGHKDFALW